MNCNFVMREAILKILGALERGDADDSNAPKILKIGSRIAKLQHKTWAPDPWRPFLKGPLVIGHPVVGDWRDVAEQGWIYLTMRIVIMNG